MPADGAEPVVIPADLWQRPEMRTALINRDIGHLFRLVRQYAGISQTRIGVAVGFSQGKVSEYMQGKAQVSALDVFERIADGLDMPDPARMLLGLAPRILTGVPHSPPPIPARDGTPASSLLNVEQVVIGSRQPNDACDVDVLTLAWIVGRLDAHVNRRTMLLIAAGLTAEAAFPIADPWERLARALAGPRVLDEDTVEHLEARTIGFHRLEYELPASALYQGLTSHLNELSTLLHGAPERFRRRLAATAGEAATLASWLAWDLKRPAQSAAFDRVSALAAQESGHPIIQACTHAYRSYALEGRAALEAVWRAQQYLPAQGDDATRAWLLCLEAEHLAGLGDRQAVERLRQAEEAFDHARPHRERAWTRFLDAGRMAAFQLSVHVRLGDERQVTAAGQQALTSVDGDVDHKRIAVIYADIAQAQLQIGDIPTGVTYARRALDAAQRTESTWGLQHLGNVEKALAGQRDPAARELLGDLISTRRALGSSPA
ncbi:helix-turn-helix domain-containing protein [Nonomuraea sp. NPDC050783]|uniref:helix-turn-helix domain-containing protein n=1 Tax=Nonomuraea sp. NPDC050783 TaxID=3154634 RepID=UPI0034668A5D